MKTATTIDNMQRTRAAMVLALTALIISGCSEPIALFPGGALEGKEQALQFATIPPQGGVIQLETNPNEPYSVNVNSVVIDGAVYIDPEEDRVWYQNIKQSPKVRVRFDGAEFVNPAFAVVVKNAAILSQFEEDRIVLRLMPLP